MMENITKKIIDIEWKMFDQVQNVGGRASCQDDNRTFYIMRGSQLSAWSQAMRESYYDDLLKAELTGHNPLSEKYGYMMERTHPEEFEKIKGQLPPREPEKDALIDDICAISVVWQEEIQEKYPTIVDQGRPVRKEYDNMWTSFETYLWGELATYSYTTVKCYAEYVKQLKAEGKNLNAMVLLNTVKEYGFDTLEEAEEVQKRRRFS